MEGLNQHLVFPFLDMQIAYGAVRDPTAGVEGLKQFLVAFRPLELGLDHPKHIRRYRFSFALRGVTNDRVAIDLLIKLGPERGGDDSTALRQKLFTRAKHFGDDEVTANKRNHMSVPRDIDAGGVVRPLDMLGFVDLKKLWVDRSSENIQCVFCDSRSDRKHVQTFWG